MAVIRRALLGAIAGLTLGLTFGLLEGGLVIHAHSLRFAAPLLEAIKLGVAYGMVVALLVAVVTALRPNFLWHHSLALAAGITMTLLGSYWMGKGFGWFPSGWPAWLGSALVGFLVFKASCKTSRRLLNIELTFTAAVGLLLVLLAPNQSAGLDRKTVAAADDAPDVVILLIDTLRADHLSCYGYQQPGRDGAISPVIDQLAAEGALFENTYAQAPWTRPSVASLMTGLYPTSHDTVTMFDRMPDELETLATLLHSRGYRTAAFSANAQVSPNFGFNRGFEKFWTDVSYSLRNYCALNRLRSELIHGLVALVPSLMEESEEGNREPRDRKKTRSSEARRLNQQVYDWLEQNDGDSRPSFIYVQYIDPHDPYEAPAGWQPEDVPGLWQVMQSIDFGSSHDSPPVPLEGSAFPVPDETAVRQLLAHYDAEIRYCDQEIGNLVARLEEDGILGPEDYLIITADHGEEFYDHTQWKHGHSLFQEMVSVPLILRGPGIDSQRIQTPVQLVDIMPTIAHWTGASLNSASHGRDLGPLLGVPAPANPLPVFFERPKGAFPMQAIRVGSRKLVRVTKAGSEDPVAWMEFDLASDPYEKHNLAAEREPDPELRSILEEYIASSLALRTAESGKTELQGDLADALGYLGYMDGIEDEE
ncbi:MAG: hypothetical protein COB96_05035 [Planctomycetota bacterium]|nr:MAG: hypothetical protein COB96_05035 [Planctomycetota bacterium]